MQMQPYQVQGPVAGANGDRIHIPTMPGLPAAPATPPPTLLTIFGRAVRKHKRLAIIWGVVTALVTAVVVLQFARPLYRAEGKYAYQPNYNRGSKPIYTPPNIQSAVQILKAPAVLEPVHARHLPDMSKDEFGKNLRIEVSRQSEFIDVSYDHPDPVLAAAVANDIMAEGLRHFAAEHDRITKDAVVQVRKDRETAMRKLESAKDGYRKAHVDLGIADPEVEQITLQTGLADVNRQLRAARERQATLDKQIEALKVRRDAPSDPSDGTMNDLLLSQIQASLNKLQNDTLNEQTVNEAKFKLEEAERKEAEYRPLVRNNILPRAEYNEIVTQIKIHRATLAHAEKVKKERDDLQKQYEDLKKQLTGGKPVRKAIVDQLVVLETEKAGIPAMVAALELELRQKQTALGRMASLQRELGTMDEEIRLLRTRVQDFDSQLTDAAERGQGLNDNDLRVHSPAAAGTAPYSTNAPKLALALVGASGLLFVGYIFLFGLPKADPGTVAGPVSPPESRLPRALVALVPVTQAAAPARTPAPSAAPDGQSQPDPVPPQTLAERLAEDGVDHGGIVLFTPTAEELKLAPAIGEMGQYFTQRGERVLVFDARHDAETPAWAGPDAPAVARTVEGYLDGQAAAATGCFVPTSLNGVEYSRADLSTRVGGVMAAHRFRQLVEEMRERYSLVFLVGPPVTLDGGDPMLATLAEGMVLVTEASASPSEVHAFVESLNQQAPARVYGTLSVPRA
jgi:uncharacterized protein involved in exopolysaccharide biosynthesis